MNLKLGHTYQAHQPAYTDTFEGENFEFDAVTYNFTVLEKPERVIADDGETKEEIPLPKHLAKPTWYWVENLTKGNRHWLCTTFWEITPV